MKLERLWPVIMHGKPELWTTRERWNAGHKGRESIIGAKEAMDCGNGQGALSQGEYPLSVAAERS